METRKSKETVYERMKIMSHSTRIEQQNVEKNDLFDMSNSRHSMPVSFHTNSEQVQKSEFHKRHPTFESPKTDYTYAKSASYNRSYGEIYSIPNMSRPSLRGPLDGSPSQNSQSESSTISTSSSSVYNLRSRGSNLVDTLAPMSSDVKDTLRREVAAPTLHKRKPVMVDGQNSPMFPSIKQTLTHLYGTDGIASERVVVKVKEEKRSFLVHILTTFLTSIWHVVTYPVDVILRRREKEQLASYAQSTKRKRATNPGFHQVSRGPDYDQELKVEYYESKVECYESKNFFYSLISIIGGIFYVMRNLFAYFCGISQSSSASLDSMIFSRTNKARRLNICCFPLILTFIFLLLGGSYLYACGKLPTRDVLYRTSREAWIAIDEYSRSGLEVSKGLWEFIRLQTHKKRVEMMEDRDDNPMSVGEETPSSSFPSCPPSVSPQVEEFEIRLKHLKSTLERELALKWQEHEDQLDLKQKNVVLKFETLKSDLEGFKTEFENELKKSRQVKSQDDEVDNFQQLQEKLKVSFDSMKEKLLNEMASLQMDSRDRMSQPVDQSEMEVMLQRNIDAQLEQIFTGSKESKLSSFLLEWLSRKYISDEELERKLKAVSDKLSLAFNSLVDGKVNTKVDEDMNRLKMTFESYLVETREQLRDQCSVVPRSTTSTNSQVTSQDVELAIKEALSKYDADKTGKTDFALESAGGSVISKRCSKTYKQGMAQLSVFGIPLWYTNNSPRAVIQPGSLPGECWPFVGSVGYLVVQLSTRVHVTEVSIDHVNKNITTFGNIDSAPKDFSVWGLHGPNDEEGKSLGNFTYDAGGDPIQYFPIMPDLQVHSFLHVEIRIYSNHGNEEYTCLYRFRVHGEPDLKVQ